VKTEGIEPGGRTWVSGLHVDGFVHGRRRLDLEIAIVVARHEV
jgi:hypothetical protein